MTPEEKARVKIDAKLDKAGWYVVDRDEYVPMTTSAVREALTQGNKESDYLFFIDNKAIAVLEAKKADNPLGTDVAIQAENYARTPLSWYGLWEDGYIPLVYLSNGEKILFKNLLTNEDDYIKIDNIHSPKEMLRQIGKTSEFGALPRLEKGSLRDCQYDAENNFENSIKRKQNRNLAVLATGSGKTYLACMASYRLLNYTNTKRVLFLVDRNNLARQTESEFSQFDLTENRKEMNTLYDIKRLKRADDLKGDIVISTIQKLFSIMTGQAVSDEDEDAEDERYAAEEEENDPTAVNLGNDLAIPSDYFQLIIVDECHRSIYGRWRAVLDYFRDAIVLGLTATPTPEAYAFFDNNVIENYTYEQSIVDGVNVPARVYRIVTDVTEHGGTLEEGTSVTETVRITNDSSGCTMEDTKEYESEKLDRSVINRQQIRKVLETFKRSIYDDLYPERDKSWEYIPKTLIFAKNDNHATEIVEAVKDVFKVEFPNGQIPEHFVQKITYSSDDSNALIRDLRNEKDFRIAVTVTLVATGTDVKPLEIVLFMKDVFSDVLYTQMRGRGCRVISDDKLKEVTPNADTKDCYYIVDAVGVTEHEKYIPRTGPTVGGRISLEHLLERLAHNELSDENLYLLRDYCATIHRRYENNLLFGRHLDSFVTDFNYSPRDLAMSIQAAFDNGQLPPFVSSSDDNAVRMALIDRLISNLHARRKLLELQRGYHYTTEEDPDTLIYAGFSVETARSYADNFEKYIDDNKDSIEALRIMYNSEDVTITRSMLVDLRDRLLSENSHFTAPQLWKYYRILDPDSVDELDVNANAKALTNLIQLVRYAYKKNPSLTSLINGLASRFSLYCGQNQRDLTPEQTEVMRQIAEFIINDGAITSNDLNEIDADLWRKGIRVFGQVPRFEEEITALSRFLLKAA
ncbi:MAG: DEAD/DEAH box helicase family protein [Ruminococcus sp.]|uniref:type I restriction endonuclease subunit R n=1 Tax=Ruminococcus sp. TaxID=41978 RepID=UPI0025DFAC7F|nr:type I restriction endonuclease subunit R [Ruminococcus sp.]MBR0529356.1 DEAD/DEAH box helicase family protein [Ruminococcus sp.]